MKKLLLFFAVAAATMMSCDPSTSIYYEIKNSTRTDLIVKIGDRPPTTIPAGEKEMVYSFNETGVWPDEPFKGDYNRPYSSLEVTINGILTSKDFWLREYWDFTKTGKYHDTYTLIITDELIETLSEDNSN
jgi:hypothetical protein